MVGRQLAMCIIDYVMSNLCRVISSYLVDAVHMAAHMALRFVGSQNEFDSCASLCGCKGKQTKRTRELGGERI